MRTRRWLVVYLTAGAGGLAARGVGCCEFHMKRWLWRPHFDLQQFLDLFPNRVPVNVMELT